MNNQDNIKSFRQLMSVFIIIHLFLLLILIFLTRTLLQDDYVKSNDYDRQPFITIDGLTDITPKLPVSSIDAIQRKLLDSIQNNIDDINTASTTAAVRANSVRIHPHLSESGLNYLSVIIDIPELRQSYKLFYEYDSESADWKPNPHELFLITCLNQADQILYSDFSCYDSHGPKIYNGVIAKYIRQLFSDDFSLYISNTDISSLYIRPFKTVQFPQNQDYVTQAESIIESMGVPSSIFTYTITDTSYPNL